MTISSKAFKWISMCEISKDELRILEVTHEGTWLVKNSKIQMLTPGFEEIKMLVDKIFYYFYAITNDIVHSNFNVIEKIANIR